MSIASRIPKSGINYFIEGFHLICRPGLRRFVLAPLLVNILLFASAIYYAVGELDVLFNWLESQLPSYLSWLNAILWPLAIITLLVIFSLIFNSVMNWIAAPFNGLLAEKTELLLTGKPINSGGSLDVIKDLPRVFNREFQKLLYFIPRALLVLLSFFIPVFGPVIFSVLWFIFSAWMMSIQYCDYPFDNHKVDFKTMKNALLKEKVNNLSLGATIMLFSMVPVLNFIVMPIAVCGATAMWVDRYHPIYRNLSISDD